MQLESYLQSSQLGSTARAEARAEHRRKETQRLRRRRVKLKASDFEQMQLIGRGAFGEVCLVRRRDTQEVLALKRIRKAHLIEKNQVESILVEREVLKGTQSPWIVHLHSSFHDAENLYLAMEYVPGGDFRTLLAESELTEQQAKFYAAEMFLAVSTLHRWGFSHR